MKPILIVPIITALLGFTIGWIAKPSPAPIIVRGPAVTEKRAPSPTSITPTPGSDTPPRAAASSPGNATPVPQTNARTDQTIRNQDDAKMARLIEVLNLSDDQQAVVRDAMARAQAAFNPETPLDPKQMLDIAADAGLEIEKSITAVLSPEQATAFAELRKRAAENSVETTAQARVSEVSKKIDLSPEQREQAAERLRESVRQSHAERPPGLDLVLESSPLPTGSTFIADSSVESLRHFTSSTGDNDETQSSFRDLQRRNLDSQLTLYQDILTPAQNARLKVDIDEKKAVIDRLSGLGQ